MDNNDLYVIEYNSCTVDKKILDDIRKLLTNAHLMNQVTINLKEINKGLLSNNIVECFIILQSEIKRNSKLILRIAYFTGIDIKYYSKAFFDDKDKNFYTKQFEYLRIIILINILIKNRMKNNIQNLYKKYSK